MFLGLLFDVTCSYWPSCCLPWFRGPPINWLYHARVAAVNDLFVTLFVPRVASMVPVLALPGVESYNVLPG